MSWVQYTMCVIEHALLWIQILIRDMVTSCWSWMFKAVISGGAGKKQSNLWLFVLRNSLVLVHAIFSTFWRLILANIINFENVDLMWPMLLSCQALPQWLFFASTRSSSLMEQGPKFCWGCCNGVVAALLAISLRLFYGVWHLCFVARTGVDKTNIYKQ